MGQRTRQQPFLQSPLDRRRLRHADEDRQEPIRAIVGSKFDIRSAGALVHADVDDAKFNHHVRLPPDWTGNALGRLLQCPTNDHGAQRCAGPLKIAEPTERILGVHPIARTTAQ